MRYLHTMVRVTDLDESLKFWIDIVGLTEVRRTESEAGKFTLVYLAAPGDLDTARENEAPILELTYNWGSDEEYKTGRAWGHLCFEVDNIYDYCQMLMDAGIAVNRPPRDGNMAFFRSPDDISVELLQKGDALPVAEPWASMENTGWW